MWQWFRTNLGYRVLSILLALSLWMYVTEEQNPVTENVLTVPLESRSLPAGLVISDRPATVKVRIAGRQELVKDLSSRDVRALVDLKDASVGENMAAVTAFPPAETEVISITPVRVIVKVDKVAEKQVPVDATVEGKPAAGYRALAPILTPSRVLVTGPQQFLDDIERAYVEVTLEGARGNYLEKLPVRAGPRKDQSKLPEWVNVKPESVEVFIPVVLELPEKKVAVQVELKGAPAAGYQVVGMTSEPQTVKVFGPEEALKDLQYLTTAPVDVNGAMADIVMEVDLRPPTGVNTGDLKIVKAVVRIVKSPEVESPPAGNEAAITPKQPG